MLLGVDIAKKLAPIYDETSLELKKLNSELQLGKVDCTQETSISSKYDIRSFPTLKYFRYGIHTPYEGGRTVKAILEFAKRATRSPIEKLIEPSDLDKFLKSNEVSFLLVGGSELAEEVFLRIAQKFQESVSFAQCPVSFNSRFGRKDSGFIVLLNDDDPEIYEGTFKEEDLTEWVLKNRFPIFFEINSANFQTITNNGKPTVIVFIDPASPGTSTYLEIMKEVSKKNKEKFNFGYIDGIEFGRFASQYEITELPNFIIFYGNDGTYSESSVLPLPHTVININNFLEEALEGKIEVKSVGKFNQIIRLLKVSPQKKFTILLT